MTIICAVLAAAPGQAADSLRLEISMRQSREVYERSSYGEAPQFAVWLQERGSAAVKTVFVTRRTARGQYAGKVECPVSLPIWIGVFRRETGRSDFPTPRQPFYDAVTGATPQGDAITISALVEAGKSYDYYIEMNVAGDYNIAFPRVSAQKRPDKHGNGQPSLVYSGEITAAAGAVSTPRLIGRSHHYYYTAEVIPDLEGIDSAREVFSAIKVVCVAAEE